MEFEIEDDTWCGNRLSIYRLGVQQVIRHVVICVDPKVEHNGCLSSNSGDGHVLGGISAAFFDEV